MIRLFLLVTVFVVSAGCETLSLQFKGEDTISIEDSLAIQCAHKKTTLIKVEGAWQFTGLYNGRDSQNCDIVTVEKNWDIYTAAKPRIDVYNYRICNGAIAQTSETGSESLLGISREMDTFIQKIARNAQRFGTADGDYRGYTIKAQALRDKDQCLVDVRVFKGINLVSRKTVNGCQ
jgi:hypothetical protein